MKWLEYTLLELVTRQDMLELYSSVTCEIFIITTVHVSLNVVTAGRSHGRVPKSIPSGDEGIGLAFSGITPVPMSLQLGPLRYRNASNAGAS
ncbi:hypothetical protein Tco_0573714 [Tanacetum coccineum]